MLSRKDKIRKPEAPVTTVTTKAVQKPSPSIMEIDLTSSVDDKNIAPIQHAKRTSSGEEKKFNFKASASTNSGVMKQKLNSERQQPQTAGTSTSTSKFVKNTKKRSDDEDSSPGYVSKSKGGLSRNPGSSTNEAIRRKAEMSIEVETPSKKKARNGDSDSNQKNSLPEYRNPENISSSDLSITSCSSTGTNGTDKTDGFVLGIMKFPSSKAESRTLGKIEKSLDILDVSENDHSNSSEDELSEHPPTKKGKPDEDNLEAVLSQRSSLIKELKDHKVCIGRLRKLSRAHLVMDGKGPRAYWETWEAPPGWTPDMEFINAVPEPAEPMSPAYEAAQMLKNRPRRSSSATRRRREEARKTRMALLEEEYRKEQIRAKNKPPAESRKINFFAKPLPTSSDEEAEREEARRAALECAQRTETEETCTRTKEDDELDFDDRLLVTSTQKMENDYQKRVDSKSSATISSSSNQMRVITSPSENPEKRGSNSSSYSQFVPTATRTRPIENVRRRLWDGNVVSSNSTHLKTEAKKDSKIETNKRETEDCPSANLSSKIATATSSSATCQEDKSSDGALDILGSMEDDMDGDAILSQLEIPQESESDLPKTDTSTDTGKTESSSLVSPFDDEDDECGLDFLEALNQLEENELSKMINSGEAGSSSCI